MAAVKITKAMQRANAAAKLEEAAMSLIEASEDLSAYNGTSYGRRSLRAELLSAARRYARALDALSRVG